MRSSSIGFVFNLNSSTLELDFLQEDDTIKINEIINKRFMVLIFLPNGNTPYIV
jgi:hypothetical protein